MLLITTSSNSLWQKHAFSHDYSALLWNNTACSCSFLLTFVVFFFYSLSWRSFLFTLKLNLLPLFKWTNTTTRMDKLYENDCPYKLLINLVLLCIYKQFEVNNQSEHSECFSGVAYIDLCDSFCTTCCIFSAQADCFTASLKSA